MRFYADVAGPDRELPWRYVHGVAHAVVYSVLAEQAPELAAHLHNQGWGQSNLRPVGISPPVFTGARRRPNAYMMSPNGRIWFGSPVPALAMSLLVGIANRRELRWGPITLTIKGTQLEPPAAAEAPAVLDTRSPILLKAKEGRYLLPDDDGYVGALVANIRHKADLLGLPGDAELEVLDPGQRRRYEVSGGFRIGAAAKIRLDADSRLIDALRQWGLGLGNIQGFGWVI
ncbi:CRISPR-associated endoribonuclease Cas6 [Plantactinospora sp. S1510]|uniref:CRISPR-associated endoribonuclease Cas6 n=1 Tax=Plantactinospora alkalitolerans TaxID=2789879 RepID=A0ABS0GSJ0_9ACTN|nr:CRISPR-associated endoribonuclease Cas6 [Plantactinospora alkalitolerans]MBF9129145.1 CRISPR-associated endoribonuclease Cas6 [Plantactinospora alkalitolerans]